MDYDAFVKMAKERDPFGGTYCPIESLHLTLMRHNDFLLLSDPDQQLEFVRYLNQQMTFLLDVFKSTSNREIDLTYAVSLAIESLVELQYAVSKYILQAGPAKRIITKQFFVESGGAQMYRPVGEILAFARAQPHVTIDTHRRLGPYNRTLLMEAVAAQLYGVKSNP